MKYIPIKFPRDVKSHKSILEWWYFNGHLKDKNGNHYSFMNCLFQVDAKKINLPVIRKIPAKNVYFAHSLLSEIEKKEFHSDITPIVFCSKNSFTKKRFNVSYTFPGVNYADCKIQEIGKHKFRIKSGYFDLVLTSLKDPLLVGGKGFIDVKGEETYYYSLTNMKTKGEIILNGKRIKVNGKSWMDHQWADTPYDNKADWTWFSLQLDNNVEVVCYEYINKNKTYRASLIDKTGKQKHTSEILIKPLGKKWKSDKTGAEYHTKWNIKIPDFNLDVNVNSFIKHQEMLYNSINYWEGPLNVSGKYEGKPIKGKGFMELVGRPMTCSMLKRYKIELKDFIKQEKENFRGFLEK